MIVDPNSIRVGRAKCGTYPGRSFLPRGAHHGNQTYFDILVHTWRL